MKKFVSISLAVCMLLTMLLTAAVSTAAEVVDTFSAGDAAPTVTTAADMTALAAAVSGGNTFSGKTITLLADVTLPTGWTGIGGRSSSPFKGTFDGNGKTVTFANTVSEDVKGGLFGYLGDGASVKNIRLAGTLTTSGSRQFIGVVANATAGTVTMKNISNSVTIQANGNLYYAGGFVGFLDHSVNSNLTIDGCIFDGKINSANQYNAIAGFLGYTGNHNGATVTKTVTIKNSVFAGEICANDPNYYPSIAGFIGYTKRESGTMKVTIEDCISAGKTIYNSTKDWKKGFANNGVILGEVSSDVEISTKNVYYKNVPAGALKDDQGTPVGDVLPAACGGNLDLDDVTAMNVLELGTLTASDFSDGSKWGFKAMDEDNLYVPVPKYFAPESGWYGNYMTILLVDAFGDLDSGYEASATMHGQIAHYTVGDKYYDEEYQEVTDLTLHYYGEWIAEVPAEVGKAGTVGHYHCSVCGKDFDENKNLLADIVIPAKDAAVTEAPATTEAAKTTAAATEKAAKKSGCGSVVGFAGVAVMLVATLGCATLSKKED